MPRLQGYVGSKKQQARQRAKTMARARLFDSARPGRVIEIRRSAPLAPRGFGNQFGSYPGELKNSEINAATYNVGSDGHFILLHVPNLGSDYTQRNGRKTLVRSCYIRGAIATNASGVPSNDVAADSSTGRMILFIDKQPNGVVPLVTELLTTQNVHSHLNLNNRDRFVILKDKIWTFGQVYNKEAAGQASTGGNQIYPVKTYKKMRMECIFNSANAGSIGDINTNALYLFFIGSKENGTDEAATFFGSIRCRFEDP